jgi:hypothetical protein
MNVFRHHHISDQREIIALANFTQNLQEEMPRSFGSQQRHATITTASNKVQLAQSITASQAWLHPQNPNPSNPEGFGTPHGSRELSSELVVWYYPPGRHVNAKNNKKRFATRHLAFSMEPQEYPTGSISFSGSNLGRVSSALRIRHLMAQGFPPVLVFLELQLPWARLLPSWAKSSLELQLLLTFTAPERRSRIATR